MDRGAKLDFVEAVHERYGSGPVDHTHLSIDDTDWDVVYPVSPFLETYRFALPATSFDWPSLKHTANDVVLNGVRNIQLSMDFVSEVEAHRAHDRLGWSGRF